LTYDSGEVLNIPHGVPNGWPAWPKRRSTDSAGTSSFRREKSPPKLALFGGGGRHR
jgi:hypothetical protein